MSSPYPYTTSNSSLITSLNLLKHPEGGYYIETKVLEELIPSPYVEGKPERKLATQIYYLLTPNSSRGKMHMNLSSTFHLHHSGRAIYTLVKPSSTKGGKLIIKQIVMGENSEKGEVRQLFVEGGWWKSSEIPGEDLIGLNLNDGEDEEEKERRGCLISEVVVPGFHWEDHKFLNLEGLKELCEGDEESLERLLPYIAPV